jgi:tetratricopeptide (TPR) repeat protein
MKTLYINICFLSALLLYSGCAHRQVHRTQPNISKENKLKARDHYTEGVFHQLDNRYENALIEFYQALLYDSSSYLIYNRIAENHMALGRYESALRYLQKSSSLQPEPVETIRLMADCYYRLKDDDNAVIYFKKVLELDPYDENSRSLLLLLYRKNNDQLGLADQYEQMLDYYGEDEDWVRKAATIYLQNGKIDDALSLFVSYIKWDSTNTRMWYSIGTAYELKDSTLKALDAYVRALDIDPDFDPAAERIYRLCRQINGWERLIKIFSPYHENDQEKFVYRIALAEAFLNQERYADSKNMLLPMLGNDEVPWQVYELMGRLSLQQQDYIAAIDHFQRIIDQDINNRIGWLFKGFALSNADSLTDAEAHYRMALKYLPEDPFLLSFHGISLNRLGRDVEALSPFEKALKVDPQNLNALVSYGLTLNRLNRKMDAINPFVNTLNIDPDNLTALTTLGMIYDELKLYRQSDSLYEAALKRFPDNDLLMNNYAYSLSERDLRLDYALEMAKKAVAVQPDNGAYLDTIGWIYFKLGNYDMALKYVEQSVNNREDSPVVIEHLGDIHYKMGNTAEAKIYWRRALNLDPDNQTLQGKLESTSYE